MKEKLAEPHLMLGIKLCDEIKFNIILLRDFHVVLILEFRELKEAFIILCHFSSKKKKLNGRNKK